MRYIFGIQNSSLPLIIIICIYIITFSKLFKLYNCGFNCLNTAESLKTLLKDAIENRCTIFLRTNSSQYRKTLELETNQFSSKI